MSHHITPAYLRSPYQHPQIGEPNSTHLCELMFEGKVRAALQLITQNPNNGALHLNAEVKDALLSKHPSKQPAVSEAILALDSPTQSLHPVRFDVIEGTLIHETALRTDGAAGPPGMNAPAWKRLCCSFKSASADQ